MSAADATQQEHLLSTLTPEERAAIEDTQDDDAALAAIAAGDEGDDDDDDQAAAEAAAEAAAAAAAKAPAAPAPAPAAAPAAATPAPAPAAAAQATETAETTPAPQSTTYRADLPADHKDKLTAAQTELAALREKFKGGELELEAYEAERDRVASQIEALRRAEIKAEIAQEMTAQSAEAQWANAIQRQFQAAKTAEGGSIDYASDEGKRADLDTFVRALGNKPENADKSMDWFMTEAHKRVLALHDIKLVAKAPALPAPAPVPNRKPPVASVTPSITNVPGADGAGDVGDEYASIDALEGLEYEAALARMTPAAREKYLANT